MRSAIFMTTAAIATAQETAILIARPPVITVTSVPVLTSPVIVVPPSATPEDGLVATGSSYRSPAEACANGCKHFFDTCNTHTCAGGFVHSSTERMCAMVVTPGVFPSCTEHFDDETIRLNRLIGDAVSSDYTLAGAKCDVANDECLVSFDGCGYSKCGADGITYRVNRQCIRADAPGCMDASLAAAATVKPQLLRKFPELAERLEVTVPESLSLEEICTSGCQSATDGCNKCKCNPDGTAICTMMMCPTMGEAQCLDKEDESDDADEHETPTEMCARGCKNVLDGCNTCKCMENGELACTKKLCLEPKPTKPRCLEDPVIPDPNVPQVEPPQRDFCNTGCKSYFDGCNSCMCGDNGLAVCTLKFCEKYEEPRCNVEETEKPIKLTVEDFCLAGCAVASDGANRCTCNADGSASCTRMAVPEGAIASCLDEQEPIEEPEHPSLEKICKSGCHSAYDGCNTCICNIDGTAACTQRYCITLYDPNNLPRCLDDEKPAAEKPTVQELCEGGCKTVKSGCNTCSCGLDGNAACTMMACLGADEFTNTCIDEDEEESIAANNDEETTTTSTTTAAPVTPESLCQAGCKTMKDSCNTCTCSTDGISCTKALCAVNEPPVCTVYYSSTTTSTTTVAATVSSTTAQAYMSHEEMCSFGCKTIKDSCNTCICGENGQVSCTMALCAENKAPECIQYRSDVSTTTSTTTRAINTTTSTTTRTPAPTTSVSTKIASFTAAEMCKLTTCSSVAEACSGIGAWSNECKCSNGVASGCSRKLCLRQKDAECHHTNANNLSTSSLRGSN